MSCAFILSRGATRQVPGLGSLPGALSWVPLYAAADGESSAGPLEGLTVWGAPLQADPAPKVAGPFKIQSPGAVCKKEMKSV